jgi:RNA polymerase sigma factor (sigma-70 family)
MTDVAALIQQQLPAARRGNREAFARIVAATQSTVTGLALAIVRDVQLSEDIAQEAYLKVWQRLDRLRNPDSFLPWLRQITRNLARDQLRRQQARPGDQVGVEDAEQTLSRAGLSQVDNEAEALQVEQDRIIREALEELPAESREVLTLFYREDQSSRQVAVLLGLSDAAVRKRLERARAGLRQEVERRLGDTLRSTVPGVAFTALISSMLLSASPPAAAAVALGVSAKTGAKLIGAVGLGSLIALLGGIAGVVLGLRGIINSSTDPEELRQLLAVRRRGVVIVVLAVLGFAASNWLPGWQPATVVFVLFLAALGWQHMVQLPRILAPRLARERERDPTAAARQRRQRLWGWFGLIFGGLGGGFGLLMGLSAAGRISLGG